MQRQPLQLPSVIALTFALTFFTSASAFAARVISCHDGDTCRISTGNDVIKVRISGIEAPELKQTHGPQSRDYLFALLEGNEITLKCTGYHGDRKVCSILIGTKDIALEMVKAGMAWETAKFSRGVYSAAQEEAKNQRRGFWAIPEMQSPACFKLNLPECEQDPMYQP